MADSIVVALEQWLPNWPLPFVRGAGGAVEICTFRERELDCDRDGLVELPLFLSRRMHAIEGLAVAAVPHFQVRLLTTVLNMRTAWLR